MKEYRKPAPTAAEIAAKQPGGYEMSVGGDGQTRWRVACPAHGGEDKNLAMWDYRDETGKARIGVKCHSRHCKARDILKALGLLRERQPTKAQREDPYLIAVYRHRDGKMRRVYRADYPDQYDSAAPCPYPTKEKDDDGNPVPCGKTAQHKHMWGAGSSKGCYILLWGDDEEGNCVLLVEGEKTAKALMDAGANAEGYTPATFRGGSGAAADADYSELEGRSVVVWPDNDEQGRKAMNAAGRAALDAGANPDITWIEPPSELPEAGDAADMEPAAAIAALQTAVAWTPPAAAPKKKQSSGGRSTRVASVEDSDEMLEIAAESVAKSDIYMRLFEEWLMRVGQNQWASDSDENVERALSRELKQLVNFRFARTHKAEAADWLADLTAPPANSPAVLPESDRARSFNLDSGELLSGAVFSNERIWLEKGSIMRVPVGARDFVRGVRPYTLPRQPAPTPKWDAYLAKAFEDPDDQKALSESLGVTITAFTGFQVGIALRGLGRTGKGVCLDLLIAMLGGPTRVASFTSPHSLRGFGSSDIIGKSAIVFPDMPARPGGGQARAEWDEGLTVLKSIIGEDLVRTERKYKSGFMSRIDAVAWMATNHALAFAAGAADASAWSERLRIHPFENVVPRSDRVPHYGQLLFDEEGPSIALKCIAAASAAVERGEMTISEAMRLEVRDAMRDAAGAVGEFVSSKLRFHAGHFSTRAKLRTALGDVLNRTAHNGDVMAMNALLENRRESFVRQGKKGKERGWHGVGLITDPVPPDPPLSEEYCAECDDWALAGLEYCSAHQQGE